MKDLIAIHAIERDTALGVAANIAPKATFAATDSEAERLIAMNAARIATDTEVAAANASGHYFAASAPATQDTKAGKTVAAKVVKAAKAADAAENALV